VASAVSHDGSGRLRAAGFDGNVLTWVRHDLERTFAVRLNLGTKACRMLVLPAPATAYVPWTTWLGASGSYGRADVTGWSLRTPWMLPELLG
jgi:hypothetical protein